MKKSTRNHGIRKKALVLAIMAACSQIVVGYAGAQPVMSDASDVNARDIKYSPTIEKLSATGDAEEQNAPANPRYIEYHRKSIKIEPLEFTPNVRNRSLITYKGGLYRVHFIEEDGGLMPYGQRIGDHAINDNGEDFYKLSETVRKAALDRVSHFEETDENDDGEEPSGENDDKKTVAGGPDATPDTSAGTKHVEASEPPDTSDSSRFKVAANGTDVNANAGVELRPALPGPTRERSISDENKGATRDTSQKNVERPTESRTMMIGQHGPASERTNHDDVKIVSDKNVTTHNGPVADINYGGHLVLENGRFEATGGHDGIILQSNGSTHLHDAQLVTRGASFVSYLNEPNVQSITLSGKSDVTQNNGVLLMVYRTKRGMDGAINLTLRGDVRVKGDIIDTNAIDANGHSNIGSLGEFTVTEGAHWEGSHQGLWNLSVGANSSVIDTSSGPIANQLTGENNALITFTRDKEIRGAVVLNGAPAELGWARAQFAGDAVIGDRLEATNSVVSFHKSAIIADKLSGKNALFTFSATKDASIGGDVTLTDRSLLSGGSVENPIKIGGDVSVQTGSILSGNLQAAGDLKLSNGILDPGNSIGTQTFQSISQMDGFYIAEINAEGHSDRIIARTGDIDVSKVHLGITQENGNGGYRLNHDYTVLTAESGEIQGEFLSANLDSTFDDTLVHLEPVSYNRQDVQIRLAADQQKVETKASNVTPNQAGVLRGLASAAGVLAVADATLLSRDVEAAVNQLSGELHAGTQSALLYSGAQLRQSISDRVSGHNMTTDNGLSGRSTVPVWAQVTGGRFTLKGNGNAAKTRSEGGGILVGGEGRIGPDWRYGAALGYNDSAIKLEHRGASKSDVNSYTAALYGATSVERGNGQFDFLAGAAYSHHNIDTRRRVTFGGAQTLKSSYDAKGIQLFAEAGYGAKIGADTLVGPYVSVAWTDLKTDDFKERGGAVALRGKSSRDHTVATTLGLRGKTQFDIGATHAFVRGGLGWRHTNGDNAPTRSMAFVNADSAAFKVTGAPIAKNVAAVNLEVGAEVGKNTTVGVSYNGQFGKGVADSQGSLFMKIGF